MLGHGKRELETSEKNAKEAQDLIKHFERMGEENHFAAAIIETVLKGYGK